MSDNHTAASDLLITALQERDIRFTRETIASELGGNSQYAQWVMENASLHTLLSKDEAIMAKNLERSGTLESFLRQPEIVSTRAVTEDEIRAATAILKSSTATCAKQITALKSQLELTENFQTRGHEADRDHGRYVTALNRQHLLEKQRTKAMAEDIMNDFESRMLEHQQQKHASKKYLLQSVNSKLVEDDDTLQKAEKLVSELELTEMDEKMEKRTLDLTSTLSTLISEEIRCRLHRLYLETLLTDAQLPNHTRQSQQNTCLVLEEDLESLYLEIDVLAEMSARQEFSQPILDELRKKKQVSAHSLEENLDMILDVLSKMTRSTNQEVDKIIYQRSHGEALNQLSTLFKEEITAHEAENMQNKKSHRRASSMSASPIKSLQPRPSNPTQSTQALESFLRRLGISSLSSLSPKEIALEKRSDMADILHHSLSVAAETPLSESLGSSDKAKELLSSILHADSHAEPSLVDRIQKENLTDLEKELTSIQKGIEGMDLSTLTEPDKFHDKFIDKWG